ncbi:hypothetical protein DV736_g5571, partial [Chaetothyriales sp. CBS 134916]
MDDLSTLNWAPLSDGPKPSTSNYKPNFAPLQPTTPSTGRASPLNNTGQPTSKPPSKPPTPALDSFSNLVSFSSSNTSGKLSLAEQQKRLAELRLTQQKSQAKTLDDQYSGGDDVWNALGAGRSTPAVEGQARRNDDNTLFADFDAPQSGTAADGDRNPNIDDDDGDDDDPFAREQQPEPVQQAQPPDTSSTHPQDKALAELVDMGFPAHKGRQALEATESGVDVQAAVGMLLNQAHAEARQQQWHARESSANGRLSAVGSSQRETAPPQAAADLGNQFLKTANSWWKQGSKKVQQAMQDLASDSDSGQPKQPKWMSQGDHTERPTPPPRPHARPRQDGRFDTSADSSRDHSPVVPSRLRDSHSPQPAFLRQQPAKPQAQPGPSLSRTALNRQANEEAAAKAYVSSARRRKPPPPEAAQQAEPGLLTSSLKIAVPAPGAVASRPSQPARPNAKATPIPVRPGPRLRDIPSVSVTSLKASHLQRERGNECFRRGDYASAHQSYSKSISHLPATHPLTIVLLTNHALTALKIGEPKTAVVDSDKAIAIIGVSKGEAERIDFGTGEPAKPMRDYYGKALMRKAEALEQMEKWSEAAAMWKEAVEGGHGGATSSAAVSRLRAANAALDRADDEKFALADAVDVRIKTWRDGKQDNLRALLGSLDTVLWPEAGWKKISMADLVLPGKVKVQYMKGIGKVHPDKASHAIPTNATTEQRMISASVFSTLNEAWDKFKAENNL